MTDYRLSRRSMLRGLGVSMALPWLESLPAWADDPRAGRASRSRRFAWPCCSPATAFIVPSGGPRARARTCSSARSSIRSTTSARSCCSSAACTTRSAEGEHPQLADRQPALGGAARLGGRDPLGDQHRPGGRSAPRAIDQAAEPGAGLREVERVGTQELFDALQLAHLLELAHDADAAGAVSGAGVRPAVQGRGRQGDESVLDAVLSDAHGPARPDQHVRPAQARRVPGLGSRSRAADRAGRARRASYRAGVPRSTSRISPARPTASRKTSASTCG